ncbi:MAG: DUF1573 domain-containing protein [Bacteroidales bacterium]|nr:DUF1573 domain-containing protein [Bacteroidales bacterium]
MHKNFFKLLTMLFVAAIMMSCGNNNDERISTEVVNNPNSAEGKNNKADLPEITFKETEHDFRKVIRGEVVSYNFKFTNTGNGNLLISNVSTSCGCTVSEYPEEPISPGEEGYVTVTFDSKGRKGFQNKSVTILANTQPSRTVLRIKAEVIIP